MSEQEQEIREKALSLLSRREYSQRELATKLSQSFPPEITDQVLASLIDQGLQSDQRFCEGFVRGRIRQGHGPIRIQAELKQKGIEPNLIQQTVADQQVDWFEQARSTHRRRFGEPSPSDSNLNPNLKATARAKQKRFLQYRGFTMDQINYALSAED